MVRRIRSTVLVSGNLKHLNRFRRTLGFRSKKMHIPKHINDKMNYITVEEDDDDSLLFEFETYNDNLQDWIKDLSQKYPPLDFEHCWNDWDQHQEGRDFYSNGRLTESEQYESEESDYDDDSSDDNEKERCIKLL